MPLTTATRPGVVLFCGVLGFRVMSSLLPHRFGSGNAGRPQAGTRILAINRVVVAFALPWFHA